MYSQRWNVTVWWTTQVDSSIWHFAEPDDKNADQHVGINFLRDDYALFNVRVDFIPIFVPVNIVGSIQPSSGITNELNWIATLHVLCSRHSDICDIKKPLAQMFTGIDCISLWQKVSWFKPLKHRSHVSCFSPKIKKTSALQYLCYNGKNFCYGKMHTTARRILANQ